jgi:hypothetical protein
MSFTTTKTFNILSSSISLNEGDELTFRLQLKSSSSLNITASLSQGNLLIYSLATITGYASTPCPHLDSASISTGSNLNQIVFSQGVSSFYDSGYAFIPNPLSGSSISSSLYPIYGDVDYSFVSKPFDMIIIYLSDGTYIEYRILDVYIDPSNNLLTVSLNEQLSSFVKDDLALERYKRLLWLTRIEDETNAYIIYQKRPGQTSYGFVIPQNLSPDILSNIDTITKEVKQKLLADQQGSTNDT